VREALSLIYRGALSSLVHGHGLRVLAGDTEGDVVAKAARMLSGPRPSISPRWCACGSAWPTRARLPTRRSCASSAATTPPLRRAGFRAARHRRRGLGMNRPLMTGLAGFALVALLGIWFLTHYDLEAARDWQPPRGIVGATASSPASGS
jgi:hypothetical protein